LNRSVCRVMVGVAGLAVLGMTATLAGAQTDEVKEKPPLAAAADVTETLHRIESSTAHPAAFTLDDLMQAPFPSYMLAAPTGAAVAWVFNAKGCSNIWVVDPSHGAKARQITPYTENDGFDIGILSVNYRGGTGYGLDYREADNLGPGGGSELNDLLGAITYLRGRQDVDSHRLGMRGPSYGGLMTALGLARASDALAAGVDYSGIHNWSTYEPIDGADANRRAVESSPIATIDQWHSPVLLVQADDDSVVPFQQAAELIEALRSHNIDHDVIMIPNEIHDMARHSSWMMLFNAADVYFDRHLDKRSAPTP
jgi:dienelactone hydrolase